MKNMKLDVCVASPSANEFNALRNKVGWGSLSVEMVSLSIENSLFFISVFHGKQLVGCGRIVGDGVMYFYLQDVIVDPAYQGQGIGHLIMVELENYLAKHAGKGSTIGLLAAKGKEEFYRRYDYLLRPNEQLGHGMCKFK